MSDLTGKTVFLAGGSTGLGKELAIALASRGCHVTIFARRREQLEIAREKVSAARKSQSQDIIVQSLDLTDPEKIQSTFASQPRLPDILYCLAGGTTNELGFLVDLDPSDVQRCMTNNYLTSAYPAQAILKLWVQDDKQKEPNSNVKGSVKRRKLVFISSAAAFVAFPGYIAYTHSSAAKCAVRALADTLRSELKRYSGPVSEYSVHISFPSNFISPSFIDELGNKPELTKQLDGTAAPMTELTQKLHSSKQVADYILKEVDKNEYVICSEYEAALLFGAMTGPSPKRGIGFVDSCVSIAAVAAGPIIRRYLDAKVEKDSVAPK
ncbi:short chain dehydrogenase [Fusarium pseudocircinatum]|uniref:Short chain dehydrogenase n=1 Tax=Fusarium pseudocircinatum TaxID=56676 RepID=A0A8H5KKB6_9HYPO|nr:short chain dehydrogenase [Fusarium pseudocircinatum]